MKIEKEVGRLQQASVLYKAAWFAWMQGFVAEAKVLVETCVAERARILGPNSKDTLSAESMLAIVLVDQGKYEAAEEMNRRALAGREKVLSADHPDTLTSVSNLALVLLYQGKYEAAEEMNRRALAGSEKVLGVEHCNTLTRWRRCTSLMLFRSPKCRPPAIRIANPVCVSCLRHLTSQTT